MSLTQEEQRQIINHGIHDLCGATCNIGANVMLIKRFIEKGTLINEDLLERLESISRSVEKAEEAGDYIYIKFKEDRKSKTGIDLISEERLRQQKVEGWTSEHDDEHQEGELLDAAVFYAGYHTVLGDITGLWPWDDSCFKPVDKIRDLVKAGALIAAEIDRLKRL